MKPDDPAFPTENERQVGELTFHYSGLSIRAYLAGLAMQGLCTKYEWDRGINEQIAEIAVARADALIAELLKAKDVK